MTTTEALKQLDEWQAQIIHGPRTFGDIADLIRKLQKLHDAAKELNVIVEGVRNRRWADPVRRLKDTPEWCAFYNVLTSLANAKISHAAESGKPL